MNIIADENVFEPIIEFLRSQKNKVINVKNSPLSGASDDEIYKKAKKNKLIILTMDKDFSRMVRFPPDRCGGIIVVKLYKLPVEKATEILYPYTYHSLFPKSRLPVNLISGGFDYYFSQ